MNFKQKVNRLPLVFTVLLASVSVCYGQQFDLSGSWSAIKIVGNELVEGELRVSQSGRNVEARSNTGSSSWSGYIDDQKLEVTYSKPDEAGRIVLVISPSGNIMSGWWRANDGTEGVYSARRSP